MSPATPPRRERRRPTVVVIGGGMAGLAAAWELSGGAGGRTSGTPDIVVLEAGPDVGGKLVTEQFAGGPVDVGPDGFLARRPEGVELVREIGLGDCLRPVGPAGAAVWVRRRARPLPQGLVLGVPTRFWPVARSGVLGPRGTLRLAVDVVAPRPDSRRPLGDRAIGPLIGRKLGRRVVTNLADPIMGGIHAGTVADMSTAAVFPLLLAVAQRRGSFMKSLRRATARAGTQDAEAEGAPDGWPEDSGQSEATTRAVANGAVANGAVSNGATSDPRLSAEGPTSPGGGPAFWAVEGGMASIARRLREVLEQRGVTVRTGARADFLDRSTEPGPPWVVHSSQGPVAADGVVLALPAPEAAGLLAPHDANAAKLLRGIEYVSVSTVTLEYHEDAVPPDLFGTGLLVPAGTVLTTTEGVDRAVVTACTYLSTKWPHLARPGSVLVRASAGRAADGRHQKMSDEALVQRVVAELEVLLGTSGPPLSSLVTRWPDALPQYRVHHLLRVSGVEGGTSRLGAVAVAGAAYRGVGIPACIASGRTAARDVLSNLLV